MGQGRKAIVSQVPGGCRCGGGHGCRSNFVGDAGDCVGVRAVFGFVGVCDVAGC